MTKVFKRLSLGALSLVSGVGVWLFSQAALADVPLTRADIESLLNRVELLPRSASPRLARLTDYLGRGDSLRTAAASRAELRFNDGSLARVGQHATFRFVPNTRTFRLSNGTLLLLIPPGQGRSTIQTPNVVTGVQGTALVVRYISAQDLTLVMALTQNSDGPVTVTTLDSQQEASLAAGQMALIQANQIQVLEFDLGVFYQTSDLIQGLHLDDADYQGNPKDPIHAVRQETLSALQNQPRFDASAQLLNPNWIQMGMVPPDLGAEQTELSPSPNNLNPLEGGVNGVSTSVPPQVVNMPETSSPGVNPPAIGPSGGSTGGEAGESGNNGATPADPNGPGEPATPAIPPNQG